MTIQDLSPNQPVSITTLANDHILPEKPMMLTRTCKIIKKNQKMSKIEILEKLIQKISTTVKALDQQD